MKIMRGVGFMLGLLAGMTAAEKPKVHFLGQVFTLAWVDPKPSFVMNEYVLPGEKIEGWTQLLTIAQAPGVPTPAVMIEAVIKSSTQRGLVVSKPQVMKQPQAKDDNNLVLFMVMKDPGSGLLEFSLQRYVQEPGQPGVKSYQYARHYPATSPDLPKPEQLNTWMKALWALNAPVHPALPK